jgi:hypothetical protein
MRVRTRLGTGTGLRGGAALKSALGQTGDAFRGLRLLLSDDERGLSAEQFLVALVRVVRDDEQVEERSARDVFEASRRRRRRLGLASFGAGPLVGVATKLTDLYCETATVCDLAEVHDLGLGETQIAAHMLVLWTIADDVEQARAIVDGTSERTVATILTDRLVDRTAERVPERLTKLSAIRALWDARGIVGDARAAAGKGSVGGVVFTGHRTKQFIKQAEQQLGLAEPSPLGPFARSRAERIR